ncbi:hypothetical protein HYH03_000586 [Edaphochlamys debaryana]|uniref:Glycosyl transferase CAP10 domain-containing protein n=1 Tax=Edaphochlamys debaryana TaxID=47281 RepID=A0A835YHV2_9CHLO|nr:hypothetical protein HYH03_000586 [Edaphochlamys debaryana]|eukprot:KAG2502094.1 hypothetical protein HYH03_000586 [Edaphochlamys debaryana]
MAIAAPPAQQPRREGSSVPMPGTCRQHSALYRQADEDLGFWMSTGRITRQLMAETVHLMRHLAYMDALEGLEKLYGSLIPDCEFVIVTTDTPNQKALVLNMTEGSSKASRQERRRQLAAAAASQRRNGRDLKQQQGQEQGQQGQGGAGGEVAGPTLSNLLNPFGVPGVPNGTYPILRASKSAAFPSDILIPSHDFHMLRYDSTVLNATDAQLKDLPWQMRRPLAFAQYDMQVTRHRHTDDPFTQREGTGGYPLCGGHGATTCPVRHHLLGVAKSLVSGSPYKLELRHAPVHSPNHLVDLHTPRSLALAAARAAVLKAVEEARAAGLGSTGGAATAGATGAAAAGDDAGPGANLALLPDHALTLSQEELEAEERAHQEYVAMLASIGSQRYIASSAFNANTLTTPGGGGGELSRDTAEAEAQAAARGVLPARLPAYLREAAQYRALLHLDGQGLSSSLERLLALGSVVLREKSGYYTFYEKALQPGVHYLPWWVKTPDDLRTQLQWIASNPDEAARIARAGATFAVTHLNADARSCYWLYLLQRLSKALTYRPSLDAHPHAMRVWRFKEQHIMRMRPARGQRSFFGQPFEP